LKKSKFLFQLKNFTTFGHQIPGPGSGSALKPLRIQDTGKMSTGKNPKNTVITLKKDFFSSPLKNLPGFLYENHETRGEQICVFSTLWIDI
jgi:hypothetical protein